MRDSGYKTNLKYRIEKNIENNKPEDKEQTEEKKKSRKRNITWYNPPYNNGVETNIGKQFIVHSLH